MELPLNQVRKIVELALEEDLGQGDITTAAVVAAKAQARAVIAAKEAGVIAGLPVAREVFAAVDNTLEFSALVEDGARVKAGERLAEVKGSAAAILSAERTALNFLMRMSGIATMTAGFVAATAGTKAQIVDTRKTAPGLRLLDKYAVRMGGGRNHRFNLSDGVLIKDNHIAAAGGIGVAVELARKAAHHLLKVEIEVQNEAELEAALAAGAEAVLLDNMEPAQLAKCVKLAAGRAVLEASGGIDLENVRAVAESGVDLISVGGLTHSAAALDISLEFSG